MKKYKSLIVLAGAVLAFSTVPVTATEVNSKKISSVVLFNETYYINTNSQNLNMRSGPGTNYSVIASIPKGTHVEMIEYGSSWSKIRYGGKEGYVSTSYLAKVQSNSNGGTYRVNTNSLSLNLRSGPGSNYSVIDSMPKNSLVTMIEYGSSWSKVRYNNKEGYTATQYLVQADSNSNNGTYYIKTNSQNLNMRSGPGTNYSIITSIPKGAQVNVTEYGSGWSKIEYSGKTGYVSTQYLSREKVNSGVVGNPAPGVSSYGFGWPLASPYNKITTGLYYSNGNYHGAVDFGLNPSINGQPVYAIGDGDVVSVKRLNNSYGHHVIIRHSNGIYSLYGHGQAGSIMVSEGQHVVRGQQLMKVGSTGNSTGPHLHLELRMNNDYNKRLNPYNYLP